MSRTQRKQRQRQADTVASLTPGTKVITTSGLVGIVEETDDEYVTLEISDGVLVQVVKAAIGRVIPDDASDGRRDRRRATSRPTPSSRTGRGRGPGRRRRRGRTRPTARCRTSRSCRRRTPRTDFPSYGVRRAPASIRRCGAPRSTKVESDVATTTTSRPGRLLIVLGVILVLLFGIMGLTKTWKPKLGLDLRGGTTITLTAKSLAGGGTSPPDQLAEAKNIISQRVNGAGVGEAEITTSGGNHINVAVPGATRTSLVKQVGQTALLYFRIVYDAQPATPPPPTPTPTPTGRRRRRRKPSTTPKPSPPTSPTVNADHDAERPGLEQRARQGRRRRPRRRASRAEHAGRADPGHAGRRPPSTGDPLTWHARTRPPRPAFAAYKCARRRSRASRGRPGQAAVLL